MATRFDFNGVAGQIEGWLTRDEGAFLHEAASRTARGHVIVEIGSWKGRSTVCLATGAIAGSGPPVIAVDPHLGNPEHRRRFGRVDTYEAFLGNLAAAGVAGVVEPIRDVSVRVASRFDREVGLLFIDGDHSLTAVQADLDAWLPWMTHGGVHHDLLRDDRFEFEARSAP